jgi:lauroyl/myristoyl acyltransferase
MQVRDRAERERWHLHGLNTGTVFSLARWGVGHFPRWLSYAIGYSGSWLAFHGSRKATAALVENLRVVAPKLKERELRALALRAYRSYAIETIDFIRSLSMNRRQLEAFLSPLSTLRQWQAGGSGMLVVTGHVGNLELGGLILRVLFGYPLTVVVLPDDDPTVDTLRREMRTSFGLETLEVRQTVETALRIRRLLSEDGAVAVISDRALDRDRVDVEFFGRPTSFLRTPALMGYLTGAPLVPSFILRQPDGRYAGIAGDPIVVPRTGDRDTNVQAAMQAFAAVLEKQVRQYPHLWYQFYPYWGEPAGPFAAGGAAATFEAGATP